MSALCWHQHIWLNANVQPRWHTWKTFHNRSLTPPQHCPTTDNLSKIELDNLTHHNISETLIRGGKSRNTMPKPGQTRKKQNRNSHRVEAHLAATCADEAKHMRRRRRPPTNCQVHFVVNAMSMSLGTKKIKMVPLAASAERLNRSKKLILVHTSRNVMLSPRLARMVTHRLVLITCTAMKQRSTTRTPLQTTHQNTFATRRPTHMHSSSAHTLSVNMLAPHGDFRDTTQTHACQH